MQRLALQRLGGAHLEQGARIQHVHALGDRERDPQVVRDQDEPHPARPLDGLQELEDLRLGGDVQRGGRLVGDQQRRIAGECRGKGDALPHAARELERVAVGSGGIVNADLGEPPDRIRTRGGLAHAGPRPVAEHLDEVTRAAQHGVQHRERVLEDHRNLVAA